MRFALRVSSDAKGNTITQIRDRSLPGNNSRTPTQKATHILSAVLKTEAGRLPSSYVVQSGRMGRPMTMQATLMSGEETEVSPTYDIGQPGGEGSLPYSGTLLTEATLTALGGRVYDWNKGGRQIFVYLSDYLTDASRLTTLYLAAEGTEQIEVGDFSVKARRLRYEAPLPYLSAADTHGVLYFGPMGELLRCDTHFLGLGNPYKASAPAAAFSNSTKGYTFAFPFSKSSVKVSVEENGGTTTVTERYKGDFPIGTTTTNARFSLLRMNLIGAQRHSLTPMEADCTTTLSRPSHCGKMCVKSPVLFSAMACHRPMGKHHVICWRHV